jgi:diguanylate cyclase (GGDEF)-like protein
MEPHRRTTGARQTRRLWIAVLAAGLLAAAAGFASYGAPDSGAAASWLTALDLAAALALAVHGHSATGRTRVAWWLVAGAIGLSAYGHLDPDLGTATAQTVVVRLLVLGLASAALVVFPGASRSWSRWLLLGLEGWLLGGALFAVLWLVVSPDRLASAPQGFLIACVWVLLDLVLAGAVLALVRRIPAAQRAGAVCLALSATLFCAGDLDLALIDTDPALGTAIYVGAATAAVVLVAFAPWIDLHPFRRVDDGLRESSVVRVPFLVACGAIAVVVLAWAGGQPSDAVLAAVVVSLLASMVASQALLGRDNARLVDQVSHQADLFRDRATRDLLTGLPNRGEFTGRVEMALTSASRGRVAVLFVDLDGFKDVNDSYGHAIGDELLVEAATRLSAVVRESDVVARFGGDEFVALLQHCSNDEALDVAERLRVSLSEPYHVSGHEVVVSASIGMARPGGDDDAEAALRNADLALYSAKEGGRDRVAVYEPAMHSAVVRRMEMAALLRQALAFDSFAVAFQPIVDLRTGKVHAMEALLRLEGIDLGSHGVGELIATAEESGIMGAVGGWVLDAAVGQLGRWRAAGYDIRVAVNVSARQLETGEFVRQVRNTLLCHHVPPSSLSLEITEHHLMRDVETSANQLAELRALGVRIALDDFGTGYSSLSYLPRLPVDQLKIDRALVARVGAERDTVPTVLQLGHDLGLSVVAEGVETAEQFAMLRAAGATHGQGFLFSPALDIARATEVVRVGHLPLPDVAVSYAEPDVSDDETARVTA